MDRAHYPFLFYLALGACNELLSFYLIRSGQSNAITGNVFLLIASMIITYQFKRWQLFHKSNFLYFAIQILFPISWLAENFLWSSVTTFASHFIVLYSFVVVLMSISMINQIMVKETRSLLKNPIFLICAGFILFFTCTVIVESVYIYSLRLSRQLQMTVFRVMSLILLLTNLLYTAAFLWIPRRRRFSFSF